MQIQKSGRTNDLFANELSRLIPKKAVKDDGDMPREETLEKDREEKGQKAEADKITELQLPEAGERKEDPVEQTFEGQLQESRKESRVAAPNADKQGITEARLNDAEKTLYPHRNPEAHERTGEKRPVNALREEMGNASDEAKRERWEKAYKRQKSETRVLDEDIGSQLTNEKTTLKKAFNLKARKLSVLVGRCQKYIDYKDATEGNVKTASMDKFAEVKILDESMFEIIETVKKEGRPMNEDEMAKIAAMKERKTALLEIKASSQTVKEAVVSALAYLQTYPCPDREREQRLWYESVLRRLEDADRELEAKKDEPSQPVGEGDSIPKKPEGWHEQTGRLSFP